MPQIYQTPAITGPSKPNGLSHGEEEEVEEPASLSGEFHDLNLDEKQSDPVPVNRIPLPPRIDSSGM